MIKHIDIKNKILYIIGDTEEPVYLSYFFIERFCIINNTSHTTVYRMIRDLIHENKIERVPSLKSTYIRIKE